MKELLSDGFGIEHRNGGHHVLKLLVVLHPQAQNFVPAQ